MKKSGRMTVAVLFTALFFCFSLVVSQDVKSFEGIWEGNLSVGGQELTIIIDLAVDDEENLSGTIDIPDQGAQDIPLFEFKVEGRAISFKIDHPEVQGDPTFNGELDESGNVISGTFTQSGYEGEFSVEKK